MSNMTNKAINDLVNSGNTHDEVVFQDKCRELLYAE